MLQGCTAVDDISKGGFKVMRRFRKGGRREMRDT
jgi:hypothetical protein